MSDAVPSSSPRETHATQPGQGSGGGLADAAALLSSSTGTDAAEFRALDALGDRQVAEQELIEPWIELHGLWMEIANLDKLLLRAIRAAL